MSYKKMGSEKYKLKWSKYETNILTAFHGLLESETLSDVTLFCEGQTFKAHRLVLAACSTHFESLFSHTPVNAPTNNQLFVILDGTRADDLQILLHFMYRGEAYLHHDRINSVLKTAEVLQVKGLSEGPRNIEINKNLHRERSGSLGEGRNRAWSPAVSPPGMMMRKKRESPSRMGADSPGRVSPQGYYPAAREQFPMYRLPPFGGRPADTSGGGNGVPSSSSPFNRKEDDDCYSGKRSDSVSPRRPSTGSKRDENEDYRTTNNNNNNNNNNNGVDDYEDPNRNAIGSTSSPISEPVKPFPSDSNAGPSGLLPRLPYKEERPRSLSERCEPESNTMNDRQAKFPDFRGSREDLSRLSEPPTTSRTVSGLNDEDVRTAASNLETFRRLAQQHVRSLPIPVTLAQGFSASDYVRLASHVRDPDNGDACSGSGTKLRCPFCERTYGYETNLRAHIRQRHQGIRVSCPYCPRTFTRNNTVRRHVAREHRHLSRNIPTRFASTRIPPDALSTQQIATAVANAQLNNGPNNAAITVANNLLAKQEQHQTP